ncbi:hypothetical protein HHI36_021974 [Cryptolaemus montrouzieri]|uniref:Uncharacterized protein n=1 Tax=Cryptolaemus montrouzieri TaxID=559131 RepID=A0ABD2MYH6_9CUCU
MKDKQMKRQNQKEYAECSMAVRISIRKDKRNCVETIACSAQEAADKNDSEELYKQRRQLGDNRRKKRDLSIRDENGLTVHNEQEQLKRWYEYFKDNTDLPEILDVPEIQEKK